MRTGQRVRVQNGTGPGIGGRVGQTTHIRAPGGGSLFEHGFVFRYPERGPFGAASWSGSENIVGTEVLWDSDGYGTAIPYIGYPGTFFTGVPAGLGGVYLLLANCTADPSNSPTAGRIETYFAIGYTSDQDPAKVSLGQHQAGHRAVATLDDNLAFNNAWLGIIPEGWEIDFRMRAVGTGGSVTYQGGYIAAFYLGDPDDPDFHGAMHTMPDPYKDTSPGRNTDIFGGVEFDTDGYTNATNKSLQVPTGLGGVYLYCVSLRWKAKNLVDFTDTTPPITWVWGYDLALIPIMWMSGSYDLPADTRTAYPVQAEVGGPDIQDCQADVNYMGVTTYWIGRLEPGANIESLIIPDVLADDAIVQATEAHYTYAALIRIAL